MASRLPTMGSKPQIVIDTVDGRNPAPVKMYKTL